MAVTWGNTATTPSNPNPQRLIQVWSPSAVLLYPTPASTQINYGDPVFWNATAGLLAIGSNAMWDTNLADTQADVAPWFLGIAMGQKNAGDASQDAIPVCVQGIAIYPCAALGAAEAPGSYVGQAAQGTNNLADQQMAIASAVAGAIGKTTIPSADGATFLQFYFASPLLFGAVTAA